MSRKTATPDVITIDFANAILLTSFAVTWTGARVFDGRRPRPILLFVLALAIHFRIVIREEEFLEQRFGQRWIEYRNRVPRYLGRVRQPGA